MSNHLQVCLVVPKRLAKSTKTALERQGALDKTTKIRALTEDQVPSTSADDSQQKTPTRLAIPTVMAIEDVGEFTSDYENLKGRTLRELGFEGQCPEISLMMQTRQTALSSSSAPPTNPLKTAAHQWLLSLPSVLFHRLGVSSEGLQEVFPRTYSLYHPMLLLPSHAFSSQAWSQLLQALHPEQRLELYKSLATALGCSHVALNAPIPATINAHGCTSDLAQKSESNNTLRSPTNLQPLYGDFGTFLPTDPTSGDFDLAFWVSTRQNGIYQTWAPLYTMFSRGNITEKARILKFPSLATCASEISAVDLYAGIGYFTFSYAAAGVGRVFCWELNPWSLEGLKRGAQANGWDVRVIQGSYDSNTQVPGKEKILAFQEDNVNTLGRFKAWKGQIPPVRHVNCGFLPTSRDSWETAVNILDETAGGWVHVHENIAEEDIEERKADMVKKFYVLVNGSNLGVGNDGLSPTSKKALRQVECQHVERVKSFAPGTMHYVLDIWVSP